MKDTGNKYIQFVGNFYNPTASYGEQRNGESLLRIDLVTGVLTITNDGWKEKKYQLKEIE